MNIYLIGYRCTGKTTIGRELARRLSMPFVDIDDMIVDTEKRTIASMVAEGGWPYFRDRERKTVKRICQKKGRVVATGGGVVLDGENVREMKRSGIVVWLRAQPQTIERWIARDERTADFRPALNGGDLASEVAQTLNKRLPLYEAAADFFIHTDAFDVDELCAEIIAALKARGFPYIGDASDTGKGRE